MKKSGTAIIKYEAELRVGCIIDVDNEETIRAHLAKYTPDAKFISVKFEADDTWSGGKTEAVRKAEHD